VLCGSRVKGRVEDDPLRVVAAVDRPWEAQRGGSRVPGDHFCGRFPMLASSSAPDFMDQMIEPECRVSALDAAASRAVGENGARDFAAAGRHVARGKQSTQSERELPEP
jgi:hypothetical protein